MPLSRNSPRQRSLPRLLRSAALLLEVSSLPPHFSTRCRVNIAHIRQSRPDYCLCLSHLSRKKSLKAFKLFLSARQRCSWRCRPHFPPSNRIWQFKDSYGQILVVAFRQTSFKSGCRVALSCNSPRRRMARNLPHLAVLPYVPSGWRYYPLLRMAVLPHLLRLAVLLNCFRAKREHLKTL